VNKPNAFFEFFWWLLAVERGHDTTATRAGMLSKVFIIIDGLN